MRRQIDIPCSSNRFLNEQSPCQCRLSRSRDDRWRSSRIVLVLLRMLNESLQYGIGDNSRSSQEVMIHLRAIRRGELNKKSAWIKPSKPRTSCSPGHEEAKRTATHRSDLIRSLLERLLREGSKQENDLRPDNHRRPSLSIPSTSSSSSA